MLGTWEEATELCRVHVRDPLPPLNRWLCPPGGARTSAEITGLFRQIPQTLSSLPHPIQCLKLESGHELPGKLVKWKFQIRVWVEPETLYFS